MHKKRKEEKEKMKFKTEKAITLIALIITVIILVILAAVSIRAIYNMGIVGRAVNGAQDYARASKGEEAMYKKVTDLLDGTLKNLGNGSGSSGNGNDNDGGVSVEYASALSVGNYEYATDTPNSVKYYSPDLSGFNGKQTYYVVYDDSGNKNIPGRCDLMSPSDVTGWYDYENKKWANVVTVNDNTITYWVWIPRFAYGVYSGTEEVYFVDTDNNCTLKTNGTETTYTANGETLTIGEKTYTLSDAFTFNNQPLKGYWLSKYEIQFDKNDDNYRIITEKDGNSLKLSTQTVGGPYYLYLNGIKQEGTITLPTTLTNVDLSKEVQIMLIDTTNGKIRTKVVDESVRIDLHGFNADRTFYVEYDSNGNEKVEKTKVEIDSNGNPTNAPDNWYDYNNKKWANIVTVNDSTITYWTYIPRFQYMVLEGLNYEAVNFIGKSKTTPDEGYSIPDSFKFNGQELYGYWISKYEVQYDGSRNYVVTRSSGNKLKVDLQTQTTGPFLLYINGVKQSGDVTSLPIEVQVDKTKDNFIMLIDKSDGKIYTTTASGDVEIDLSGFSTTCTYYVEYDENGNEKADKTLIQVNADGSPKNAPENWYDYGTKKWANVMTKGKDADGNELITYWTYIPRFEYFILPGINAIELNFLPVGKDVHDGYSLSEAFMFNEQPIKGYWISKYEVQVVGDINTVISEASQ